ncbi:glycosyltransferase family 2 protein [Yoonia sp.]|uniref:glycosyltransferase family 2 protein n=1 Tax=Yoonia sp. TaxID=2212373 RepID=UPI00391D8993
MRRDVFVKLGGIAPDQVNDEDTDFCCRLVAAGHRAWFEPAAGCVVYRAYETGPDVAPQLTLVFDPVVASQCYARTFVRNEAAFRKNPAARWFLLFRALRASARNQVDEVARDLLAGLPLGVFKLRGYLYWQTKRLGKRLGYR